jgi:signal transduction histidine kinase
MGGATARRGMARSLRLRLALLTLAGTLVPIAIFGWLSLSSVQELQNRVLAERQNLAASVAAHVNSVVNSQFELLEAISTVPAGQAKAGVPPSALRESYARSRFFSRVLVLDAAGTVLQGEPPDGVPALGTAAGIPSAESVLKEGSLQISPLWKGPGGARRLFMMVALRGQQGQVVGTVAGEIDPQGRQFRHLLDFVPLDSGVTVDLIDQHGVVIASTAEDRLYSQADHLHFLEGLIERQRSAVGTCHGCHQSGTTHVRVQDVMAFAPLLSRPSWGVDIRQAQAAAFGTTDLLRWKILIWAPALALVSLFFAWGVATSVTAPLSQLVRVAGRIAGGELQTPIPEVGRDEVGRLGRALERMRIALKQSLEEVERGRDQLEVRVRERTAEIERLYQELQQRDQLRARLLEKLIGAQEEERRRIARELHDETSQEIGALVLALDTALATLPENVPRTHVEEAKALAVHALDGIYRLGFDLRPSVLDDLGLFRAIAWYAERDLKRRGVAVRCEFDEEDVRLPAGVETALFRAVQELITNIVKHSRAESVLIQGVINHHAVTIEIEDDGQGFEPDSISMTAVNGRGLGLAGIRERMELLGGTARIESSPGHGTRVVLTAPMGGDHGQDPRARVR